MPKKRLVASISVKSGIAVQSYGYTDYRPVGSPLALAQTFDRWNVDEILLQAIDRSSQNQGPDYELLKKVAGLGLASPLSYGGGIRNADDAHRCILLGADRVVLGAQLFRKPEIILEIASILGTQAVILSLPIRFADVLMVYDYVAKVEVPIAQFIESCPMIEHASEYLVIDYANKGRLSCINEERVKSLNMLSKPLILFGGLCCIETIRSLLSIDSVNAVALGNTLLNKEHSYQHIKQALDSKELRYATFSNGDCL
jgi:cyclase